MDPVSSSDHVVRLLGYAAGTITTLAFVPQVLRSFRTRSTGDLSRTWLTTFITGVALWLVYGILLREPPIIVANAVTLGLGLTLLWIGCGEDVGSSGFRVQGSGFMVLRSTANPEP